MAQVPATRRQATSARVMVMVGMLTLLLAACAGQLGANASPTPVPVPASTPPGGAPTPVAPASPSPNDPGDGPPDLLLSVGGASPVAGLAGGGCWSSSEGTGCADTGWLVPETPIEAELGAQLRVEVGAPLALIGWDVVAQAADAPFDGEPAFRLANRQPGAGAPPNPIVLASLPPGDWVVSASVWFLRGGDVSSYWRVVVR